MDRGCLGHDRGARTGAQLLTQRGLERGQFLLRRQRLRLFLGCVQWIDGVSLEDRNDGTLVGVTKVYWYDRPKDGQLVRVVLSGRKPLPDAAR